MYILSIIVPVYNGEKYIKRIIRQIDLKNNPDIQLVMINDGSKDRSLVILKKYNLLYENLLIDSQPNKGIAATRNRGLALAEGNYIVFMDQDDKLNIAVLKHTLSKMIQSKADFLMSNYSTYDGSLHNCIAFKEQMCLTNELLQKVYVNFLTTYIMGGPLPVGINYIPGSIWNCIFRKNFLINNEISFKKFVDYEDDFLFLIDCFSKAKMVSTSSDIYYCWIVNRSSESHRKKYIFDYVKKREQLNQYLIMLIRQLGYTQKQSKKFLEYLHSITMLKGIRNICANADSNTFREIYNELIDIYGICDYEINYHVGEGYLEKIELFLVEKGFFNIVTKVILLHKKYIMIRTSRVFFAK